MTRVTMTAVGLTGLLGVGLLITAAAPPAATREASRIQADVVDQMTQLEQMMAELSRKLASTDPRSAAKLLGARRFTIEHELRGRMQECRRLVDKNLFAQAQTLQKQVLDQLDELLSVLLTEETFAQREKEIKDLRDLRNDIDDILRKQRELQGKTGKSFRTDPKSGKDSKSGDLKSDGKDAEDAEDRDPRAGKDAKDGKDSKSAGAKTDGKHAKDGKDRDPRAGKDGKDSKSADGKTDGKDSAQAKAGSDQSGKDSKSGDGKDKDGKDKDGKDSQGGEAGKDKDGKDKESKLAQGRRTPDPKELENLRDEQAKLREKTGRLIRRLEKDEPPSDSDAKDKDAKGSKSGGDKSGTSKKSDDRRDQAKKATEKARQHQGEAEKDLGRGEPEKAEDDQERAAQELERAKRALEEELQQLRKEQQLEVLMRIEAELRRMLSVQQAVNKETRGAQEKRGTDGRLDRELQAAVRAAGDRQAALAGDCLKLNDLFSEDASALVFPRVMRHVEEQMRLIAGRLHGKPEDEWGDSGLPAGEPDTGEEVQRRQHGVELRLTELIEAMKRAQKEKRRPPPSDGMPMPKGEQGPPPLVPPLAELKMLRTLLKAVNDDTARLEQRRSEAGAEQAERIDTELRRLAGRQRELAEVIDQLNKMIQAGNQ